MKKIFLLVTALSLLILCTSACAYLDTAESIRLNQTASGRSGDYVTDLSDGWLFGGSGEDASAENYSDSTWPTVNLPHTWNVLDTADGNGSYNRTNYWYRKVLDIDGPLSGKCYYLEFLGANQQTDLYVNGQHIRLCGSESYTHKGGYTAFRYDITNALRPGSNQLAVRVDNTYSEEIAPLSGDFNMYGGIYRRVFIITVNDLHFDLDDNGSSGLYLTTPNVRSKERPKDLGTLNIRTAIVNDGPISREVTVTVRIDGENAPADITRTVTLNSWDTLPFEETVMITDPHLWNGIDYSGKSDSMDVGYRYCVTLAIAENGETLDIVTDQVGFRYFYADKDTGFYLNGQSHPLRGVNRHQSKENLGNALIEADHERDIELIMEIGANAVRLAHYPQADIIYDLCDENGIILWTEIPLVNAIGKAENFLNVTKAQLTELIRQQYNRPSVCFWGLENEISYPTVNDFYIAKKVLAQLDNLAHQEDSSGRYTTIATNGDWTMDRNDPAMLSNDDAEAGWKSDLIAWNIYPGWYYNGTIEDVTDSKSAQDSRPMGLSEYGWGASTSHHELYPVMGQNGLGSGENWHPEEYQSQMHEQALKYINTHPHLWGTFVWNMFDFNVDNRNEGSTPGQNDKGLVSNDRTIKKDSFYLYKANWDKRTPLVYITSARYTPRKSAQTYVKVYSNCDSITLYQNGTLLGDMTNLGDCVFVWEDLVLSIGENKIHAVGVLNGQTTEDTCVWYRPISSIAALKSNLLPVNEKESTVTLPWVLTVKEVKSLLSATDNGCYQILQGDEEAEDSSPVLAGMKAAVVSESGDKERDYTFVSADLLAGRMVWATSSEESNLPENAVDGDSGTRWAAMNNQYPQSITVDLGELCILENLTIDWYEKNDRYYSYLVDISVDGETYTLAADHRNNRSSGMTRDNLGGLQARYVRVTVHSCSDSAGYASLYTMKLDGWEVSSDLYILDHKNRLILVPDMTNLDIKTFVSHLTYRGVHLSLPDLKDDLVGEGSLAVFTDVNGNTVTYTVTTEYTVY